MTRATLTRRRPATTPIVTRAAGRSGGYVFIVPPELLDSVNTALARQDIRPVENYPAQIIGGRPTYTLARIAKPGARSGPRITERELRCLEGLANGLSNDEIARAAHVSIETVRSQLQTLYRKLRARDRAHAVYLGMRAGLIGDAA